MRRAGSSPKSRLPRRLRECIAWSWAARKWRRYFSIPRRRTRSPFGKPRRKCGGACRSSRFSSGSPSSSWPSNSCSSVKCGPPLMRLEFFADRQTFILVLVALVTLAMLATGFVYPRPFSRRLSALRLAILVCFFAGAVSLTLVYPAPFARSSTLFVLVDRSLSMDQKLAPDGKTRGQLLDDIQAKLEAACESAGIEMKSVYFAEEASDQSARIGDRRTTRFSPALSLLLEKISAADGNPARTRALLISDGAAADEPMIDPYLSAFVGRGVSIDVWSVGGTSEASLPKIYFRIPPPPVATVGESVPLDLGVMSPASARLTASGGGTVVSAAEKGRAGGPPPAF